MKQFLAIIFFLFSSSIFSQDDPQSEFFLAENYFREGDYEKATQIYKKLYDVSPFNTTYLYKLISCYQQTESFETAENLLLNRLKKDPSQTYLHVLIGNNYSKLQKENLAEIEFQKALKSIENNSPYATTIAQIFNDYNLLILMKC